MSFIEAPRKTVERFSQGWAVTDPNSLLAEFVTISKETNREPDTYHFPVKNGELIDSATGRPVLDFIEEGVEKDVARKLQAWADANEEGMALWISPKSEKYPCPKVIIHKIAYTPNGEKAVLNTAILFDGEIANPEYKRQTLYTLPDSDIAVFKILNWIGRKSGEKVNLYSSEKTSRKKAAEFVDQIKAGMPTEFVISEMQRVGFLGQNPISCPISFSDFLNTASKVFTLGGKDQYGKLEFTCPHCRGVNVRPHGQLISSCQHCGKDVRC